MNRLIVLILACLSVAAQAEIRVNMGPGIKAPTYAFDNNGQAWRQSGSYIQGPNGESYNRVGNTWYSNDGQGYIQGGSPMGGGRQRQHSYGYDSDGNGE